MPLLVCQNGFTIIESDCIARYLLDKHATISPSFSPPNIYIRSLSDQLCRVHDVYISPIQGCMYKAPGYVFGGYGTNRVAAKNELLRQLHGLEGLVASADKFSASENTSPSESYLCGNQISLADITLYPTLLFCDTLLPKVFGCTRSEYLGPRLTRWYDSFAARPEVRPVGAEISTALEGWSLSGRFEPILEELRELSASS